jgi:hypothetical protein
LFLLEIVTKTKTAMIYKNETRIGNLFNYEGYKLELIKVDDVPKLRGEDGRQVITGLTWDTLEPVPVTIPLLKGYGFTYDSGNNTMHIPGIFLIQHNGQWCLMQGHSAISKPFKYLHELQNLYFGVIGTELINSTSTAEGMNHYRFGNFVTWGSESLPITIITTSAADSSYRSEPPFTRSTNFKGIDLSENWFSRFGFTINITLSHPLLSQFYFNKEHDGYYMRTLINGYINKNHPVEFVHELQNLLFIITGHELSLQ